MPPSWPAIRTWSALAFATPAATVPTPTSATSFTDTERLGVRAAQVVDELLEVLDRVDVVVRRRRDQADAGRRVAHPADVLVDLVAGQLAALAGLGALGHLDLQLVGVDQVVDRHAEAARGHLLDRRAAQVAVVVGREAARVLPALARVRLPPRRFIAIARVSWASVEIEPSDIAPVAKRLTISWAGSTSSSGDRARGRRRTSSARAASRWRGGVLVDQLARTRRTSPAPCR